MEVGETLMAGAASAQLTLASASKQHTLIDAIHPICPFLLIITKTPFIV
jgi:hypothetical protein